MWAVKTRKKKIIEFLVHNNPWMVHEQDENGHTAFTLAESLKDFKTIEFILEKYYSEIAQKATNESLIETFKFKPPSSRPALDSAFLITCKHGQASTLEMMINKSANNKNDSMKININSKVF